MNIGEAVKEALATDTLIYRKSTMWSCRGRRTGIKPTNSYETCIAVTLKNGEPQDSSKNWNPTADDLMADDWELFKV